MGGSSGSSTDTTTNSGRGTGTSARIVALAGAAIILIALIQTVRDGAPDKYTAGALLALALGGGVGRVADQLVKGYVSSQVQQALHTAESDRPTAPASPPPAVPPLLGLPAPPDASPGTDDEAPA